MAHWAARGVVQDADEVVQAFAGADGAWKAAANEGRHASDVVCLVGT